MACVWALSRPAMDQRRNVYVSRKDLIDPFITLEYLTSSILSLLPEFKPQQIRGPENGLALDMKIS